MHPLYVNDMLEEYDDLVQYYTIQRTKHQMEDSSVELNEWWELAEVQFKEKMIKNLIAHKKDKDIYKQRLFAFTKAFPNFLYHSFDSLEPFSLVNETNKVKGNGIT